MTISQKRAGGQQASKKHKGFIVPPQNGQTATARSSTTTLRTRLRPLSKQSSQMQISSLSLASRTSWRLPSLQTLTQHVAPSGGSQYSCLILPVTAEEMLLPQQKHSRVSLLLSAFGMVLLERRLYKIYEREKPKIYTQVTTRKGACPATVVMTPLPALILTAQRVLVTVAAASSTARPPQLHPRWFSGLYKPCDMPGPETPVTDAAAMPYLPAPEGKSAPPVRFLELPGCVPCRSFY
jgi:hypothetical protein